MNKRVIAMLLALCMFFAACGQTEQSKEEPQEADDAKEWDNTDVAGTSLTDGNLRILEKSMPDADMALQQYLPENGSAREILWDMSGDVVYRFVRMVSLDGVTRGYCLERLAAPYEQWECQPMGLTDWTEDGTQRYIDQAAFDGNGNL